ncbi:hypothetical protein KM043_002249 [Ampulex compressa]|nr:hypothetical protein KM043_002249 [Ampulex compressa]
MRDGTELSGIEKGRGEKRIGDIAGIGRLHCLAAASSSCYATRCQNKGANWKAETACAVPRLFRQGDTSGKTPPPWDYENTGEKISGIVEMRVRVLRPRGQLQNGGARILRKFAVQHAGTALRELQLNPVTNESEPVDARPQRSSTRTYGGIALVICGSV